MKFIPTMTVNECVRRMRELGVSLTDTSFIRGVAAGAYPFAVAYKGEVHNHIEIYTTLFERWVAERCVELPEDSIPRGRGGSYAEISA